jgi:hypothetical protein
MKKNSAFLAVGLLGLACLGAIAQQKPDETPAARTLKVKLDYTGSGTVDQNHKIFIFLFDSPDFMTAQNVMPITSGQAQAKGETVTFASLGSSTVYIVAAFDPKGEYDGQSGPPPSGASLGLYSKTPGTPEPVKLEAGKTAEVQLPFDDSMKMP